MLNQKDKINIFIVIFETLTIFVAIGLLYRMNSHNIQLTEKYHERISMLQVADRLRQSSDDLTHFARTYAVTGDREFRNRYFTTLDIRNGDIARPLHYEAIYWDLPKELRELRHPPTEKISLKELISQLPFEKYELKQLNTSEANSNDLVDLEIRVFQAIENNEQALAIQLLHSKDYYRAKEKIMAPIDRFMIHLNERTETAVETIESKIQSSYTMFLITSAIFLFGNILIFTYLHRRNREEHDEKRKLIEKSSTLAEELQVINAKLENIVQERTEELESEKKRYKSLLDLSSDGIFIVNSEGYVTEYSNKAREMLGYSDDEFSTLHISDWDQNYTKEELIEILKNIPSESYTLESEHTRKDGSKYYASISAVKIRVNGEELLYSSVRDITDEKQLQEKVISQKESLLKLNEELTLAKQRADDSAKSLLGIINDILDFSKIEAGKLTIEKVNFDLFKVVDNAINLIELKAHEKNIEMIVSYDPELGKQFYGDSLRIGQILINLLGNAVKFTEDGEIALYIEPQSKDIVRFEVRDTGIGLSDEQKSRLFKSFSQADGSTTRRYGGTGLGLSISKQLVELMDGKIWVESELGRGSSFIFELELPKVIDHRNYNIFSDKRVLIVDDNSSWHDILTHTLELFQLQIEHSYSGQDAINKIVNQEREYDAILMDWNMPRLDGIETSKIITEKLGVQTQPVIMVSSFRQESIAKLAKDVGIDIFLQKPINPSYLNDILSSIFLKNIDFKSVTKSSKKSLKGEIDLLNGSHILLVEDNAINQEIVTGLLANSGINIDIADNGKVAIERYRNSPEKYELILMDLQMPIMGGLEATTIIREEDRDIPIIALTANAMREDLEKTEEIGMNEHINKPINVERLYEVLLKYISKKRTPKEEVAQTTKKDADLLQFNTIDTEIGLSYLADDREFYIKLVKYPAVNGEAS